MKNLLLLFGFIVVFAGCKMEQFENEGNNIWPNGEIIYCSLPEMSINLAYNLSESFRVLEEKTPIIFRKADGNEVCFDIKISDKNWATIGHSETQERYMLLTPTAQQYQIIHELGHIISLVHEHQRLDRDEFVNIIWDNIKSGEEYNFEISDMNLIPENAFSYDYESIMHYNGTSHSTNGGETIISVTDAEVKINQILSEGDILKIQYLYGE